MNNLSFFKHDLHSRSNRKMVRFLKAHGYELYGLFWMLVEEMYATKNLRLKLGQQDLQEYAELFGCSTSKLKTCIEAAIECRMWFVDELGLGSYRVDEELKAMVERRLEISEKRRAAAASRWSSKEVHTEASQPVSMQTHASALDKKRIDKKRRDKSRVEINNINSPDGSDFGQGKVSTSQPKGGTLKLSELKWPPCLDNQACKEALVEWLAHKKQRRESYKNVASVDRLLKHWGKTSSAIFLEAVDTAIRNNWAGLHPPDLRRKPDGIRKTNDDLNRELHERIAAEEAAAAQAEAEAGKAYEAEQAAIESEQALMEVEHGN